MFYQLSEALTHKFIEELRHFWSFHPNYQDLVRNIQNKYSFEERPQYGMVVNFSSASPLNLSPDLFVGNHYSYASLRRVGDYPGLSVEWVREDTVAIQNNGGTFPSAPGIYYLDIQENGTDDFVFFVDPLLEARDELLMSRDTALANGSFFPNSLRVYGFPGNYPLTEGTDYVSNSNTGEIVISDTAFDYYKVFYRYAGESTGPHPLPLLGANNTAIPGVILAFGRHVSNDDKMAVTVSGRRGPCAQEFGGRWTSSLQIDVISRDPYEQKEITDRTLIWILSTLRPKFSNQGIEIMEVSHGGETEEMYDETGDDYYYNASISISVETEWIVHVPVWNEIKNVVGGPTDNFTLKPFTDPFFFYPRVTASQVK